MKSDFILRQSFLLSSEMFAEKRSPDIMPQQGSKEYSRTVCRKVHPVTTAVFSAGGLKDFDASAHQDGAQNGTDNQSFWSDDAVVEQILCPQESGQSSVHA